MRPGRGARAAGVALLACACVGESSPPAPGAGPMRPDADAPAPPALQLVDSAIAPAIAGEAGWGYQRATEVDLDGDGQPERVVLTARVELYRGRPAWDDGQPWQVYVETPGQERTYLYAQRLQLGTLTLRIGQPAGGPGATVVLLEHLPDRLRLVEVTYRGPGRLATVLHFERTLDPRGDLASPMLP